MNRCQHFNNIIKKMGNMAGGGNLPSQYQQVEYLQSNNSSSNSSGSNWIHIDTGVNYFANFEVECVKTENTGTVFCGCGNNANPFYGATLGRYSQSSPYITFFNTGYDYYMTSVHVTTKGRFKWKDGKIFVNDIEIAYKQKPTSTRNFILFGYRDASNDIGYKNMRFYSAKLWDDNGKLIRNYIPCFKKSDNTPGMYDLVTRTFNPGTGTSGYFTVGNNV